KHYYVGQDEVEKLLAKAQSWLPEHPERNFITQRYLARQPSLIRQALARLTAEEAPAIDEDAAVAEDLVTDEQHREQSLHEQRLGAALATLRASGAKRVL